MAKLPKETLQKLAVLRTTLHWINGAYGSFRVQKTLFYADRNVSVNACPRHFFTFKKWHYGQYSEDANSALRNLVSASKLELCFDGPTPRIAPRISEAAQRELIALFDRSFPEWSKSLQKSFGDVGYMRNDALLQKAHRDPTYTESEFGQIIFESELPNIVDIPSLDDATAERLSDLVDERLATTLEAQFLKAIERPFEATDWRSELFGNHEELLAAV